MRNGVIVPALKILLASLCRPGFIPANFTRNLNVVVEEVEHCIESAKPDEAVVVNSPEFAAT